MALSSPIEASSGTALDSGRRRKFSVLLICRSYPPVIGGSEIEAQRVCAALLERGHRVEVVCCGGDPMPPTRHWTDPWGVPVHMYGRGPGRWNDYKYALGVAWTLLTRLRDFEIAYFLMPGVHVLLGVPVAKLLGKIVVMKFAGSSEIQKVTQDFVGPIELAFLRRWSDRTMVLNDGMIEEAISVGFRRDQLLWMPNPVDTTQFAPVPAGARLKLRSELGLAPGAFAFVFVGRFAPEKQLPSLMKGFSLAAASNSDARLVLIGDGPLRQALEQQAREEGVSEKVIFAGMCDAPKISRWLQASDVFTLVSAVEGLPVSLIEAMSTGLPAIVSDIPAMRQLIDEGVHGLRIHSGDAQSIASAMNRLLADRTLAPRLGEAARPSVVGRFSTQKVLSAYEDMFESLLGRSA